MGSGVRARFLPSPALLHGGWDVGCCRIGLAASAGFGEPELTCPCHPGQAPAGRRIPPPGFSQIQFEESSGGGRGTLSRVPQTPQNFSEQIMIDGIRRSCPVPAFSCAPAWRLECRVLQNRLNRFCRVWRTRIDLPVPPGASPRRTPHPTHFQCRIPPIPRGCKGRSPLHKNNLSLPLPHRGRGVGG